ncbi:hypothetical protein BU23DRAFT_594577 [Bimuria novae-zelandiae CBS 107.79]|uniref:MARVEL domain-containing protein n=1 Tax=Bimuria novae-zelandiae CBS 107.79 TaxID=1447943 RepID=A0A6A5VRI6_9PLEO|nr:hypothetical protein BU23DRAFT_594577 [Bimuria novae-zelandiae CBS 107.79]
MRWYPSDPRWHGAQRHYFNFAAVHSLILIIYVVLVIVEGVLMRRWTSDWGYGSRASTPYDFWARHGPYLLLDAALSLVSAWFIHRSKWHPVAALVTSVLAVCLWLCACLLNALLAYYSEYSFAERGEWEKIAYAQAAMQGLLVVCYAGMVGCAGKAVGVWKAERRVRRAEERVGGLVM